MEELNVDSCKASQISGITDEFINLQTLSMTNNELTSLKGFPKLPNLRKVHSLPINFLKIILRQTFDFGSARKWEKNVVCVIYTVTGVCYETSVCPLNSVFDRLLSEIFISLVTV